PTSYFEDAEKKVADFVVGFGSSEKPSYLVLGIRGKYGSGKTHLALQVMDAVSLEYRSKAGASVLLYAKADKPDLLSVYTEQIAGKLREIDLKTLAAGYYRKVLKQKSDAARRRRAEAAGAELATDSSKQSLPEMAAEAEQKFGTDNPDYILNLARQNLLPADDFLARASKDLSDTDPALREDF